MQPRPRASAPDQELTNSTGAKAKSSHTGAQIVKGCLTQAWIVHVLALGSKR